MLEEVLVVYVFPNVDHPNGVGACEKLRVLGFGKAVRFAHPSFEQVAINGFSEVLFWHREHELREAVSVTFRSNDHDSERVQIKRGTLRKELLYLFSAFKFFTLRKSKWAFHRRELLPDNNEGLKA